MNNMLINLLPYKYGMISRFSSFCFIILNRIILKDFFSDLKLNLNVKNTRCKTRNIFGVPRSLTVKSGLRLSIYLAQLVNKVIRYSHYLEFKDLKQYIHFDTTIHSCYTYGENINDKDLFFISNYCYTEIDKAYNELYSSILLPKTDNGFIIWQNGGNNNSYPIDNSKEITGKNIQNIIEEKPQTDSGEGFHKNYFVYY